MRTLRSIDDNVTRHEKALDEEARREIGRLADSLPLEAGSWDDLAQDRRDEFLTDLARQIDVVTHLRDLFGQAGRPGAGSEGRSGLVVCGGLLAGLRKARAEAEAIDPSGTRADSLRHLDTARDILRVTTEAALAYPWSGPYPYADSWLHQRVPAAK